MIFSFIFVRHFVAASRRDYFTCLAITRRVSKRAPVRWASPHLMHRKSNTTKHLLTVERDRRTNKGAFGAKIEDDLKNETYPISNKSTFRFRIFVKVRTVQVNLRNSINSANKLRPPFKF